MALRSRTPTRIDFAGGTTDLLAFAENEGGAVINAAIDRYAYCTLTKTENSNVVIRSQDLGQFVEADDIRSLEYDGNLDLLKAAVRRLGLQGGFEISVRCDAPPGSGTGSSASVGVALLGILDFMRAFGDGDARSKMSRFEIADLACELELEELNIVGGKQDQYAAALGGFNYMEFFADGAVAVEPVAVPDSLVYDLQKQLIICYTGQSRLSGDTNDRMISAYKDGDETVVDALRTVKRLARDIYRAFLAGDLAWFGELMLQEWDARRRLAPGVVTEQMEQMKVAAMDAGAVGAKVCGAGGGGCCLFLAGPDSEADVREALEAHGGQVLDFSFDTTGLRVWETH
ncbi:MAG: hypothetical protein R6V19_12725 [Armatimonadota bacterium]